MWNLLALARQALPGQPKQSAEHPVSLQKTSRTPAWWREAPPEAKSLYAKIEGWRTDYALGQLHTRDDMQIQTGGMSGDWPDVYYDLFKTAKFADSYRTKDPATYGELTGLVKDGIKGLVVYSLGGPANPHEVTAYNGCVRSATDLLSKDRNGIFPITPGSSLEREVCEIYSVAVSAVYDRKVKDGYGKQADYLLDQILPHAYEPQATLRGETPALQETTRRVFVDLYSGMDQEQRAEFNAKLRGSYYANDYIEMVENLTKQAGPAPAEARKSLPAAALALEG